MADFCRQCTLELFGLDDSDFENIFEDTKLILDNAGFPVLCEGCGPTIVDWAGQCISGKCDNLDHEEPEKIYRVYQEKYK